MSPTPEEPNLQNGNQTQPHIPSESQQTEESGSDPESRVATIPQQQRESESVDEEADAEPRSEPESRREQSSESIQLQVVTDATDPRSGDPEEASIPSNGADNSHPALRKDEGSRTFTMRELLNGLKGDDGNDSVNESEGERPEANSGHRFVSSFSFVVLHVNFTLGYCI